MGVNENGRSDETGLSLSGPISEEDRLLAEEMEANELPARPAVERARPAKVVTGTLLPSDLSAGPKGDGRVSRSGDAISAVICDTSGRELHVWLDREGAASVRVRYPGTTDVWLVFDAAGAIVKYEVRR